MWETHRWHVYWLKGRGDDYQAKCTIIRPQNVIDVVITYHVRVGFITGNPWVRKSQPTPIPAHTIPNWPRCGMKPMVCSIPVGLSSSNLLATSWKQPAHINGHGGVFCEVLEEEEVVVMRLVQGQGACGAKLSHRGSVLAGKVWVGWFCVEGTIMGRGTWDLRWQGDVIWWHAKGVWFGQKVQKPNQELSFC